MLKKYRFDIIKSIDMWFRLSKIFYPKPDQLKKRVLFFTFIVLFKFSSFSNETQEILKSDNQNSIMKYPNPVKNFEVIFGRKRNQISFKKIG